jgi:hypothetical protein
MRYIDPHANKVFDFYCQQQRWRRLPADTLATLILEIRRQSADQHLSSAEWHELDLMRRRLTRLQREAV